MDEIKTDYPSGALQGQSKTLDDNIQVVNEIIVRNQKKSNKIKMIFAIVASVFVVLICLLVLLFPNGADITKLWQG